MANLFNGKLFIEPGAAVATDFDSVPRVAALSSGIAVCAAESTNGIPASEGKVYEFAKYQDAKAVLKGGPALDLINLLFNPSNSYPGAEKVLFVRTNNAKRADLAFRTEATPKSIVLTPVLEASHTYAVLINITVAGTTTPVQFNYTTEETPDVADFINTLYTHTSEIVGIASAKTTSELTLTAEDVATDFSVVIPDGSPSVVSQQVTPAVESELLATIYSVDYGKNQDYDFKFADGNASFYMNGQLLYILEDIVTFNELKASLDTNQVLKKYFTITIEEGKGTQNVPNTLVRPFTVYEDTPTTLDSFTNALEKTSSKNKSAIISQFDSAAYHNAMIQFQNSSDFEAVVVVGGALGETPTQVMQRAKAINAENVVLAYPGVYLTLTEETKLYSPVYHAALVAGLMCGLQPQIPLTRKQLAVQGFEEVDFEGNSEKTVREQLINCGVLFSLEIEDAGYCINKGINTIQGQINRQILEVDNKTNEISVARIRYQMQKEIRVSAARTFPGTTRLKPSKNDVMEFYANYLNSKVGTYLTGWDPATLSVWVEEDAWYGTAKADLNGPINQAFFTLSFGLNQNL